MAALGIQQQLRIHLNQAAIHHQIAAAADAIALGLGRIAAQAPLATDRHPRQQGRLGSCGAKHLKTAAAQPQGAGRTQGESGCVEELGPRSDVQPPGREEKQVGRRAEADAFVQKRPQRVEHPQHHRAVGAILDRNTPDLPAGVKAVETVKQVGARSGAATHLALAPLAAAARHAVHPGAQIQRALGGGNLTRPGPRGQQQGQQRTGGHHRLNPCRSRPGAGRACTGKLVGARAGHGLDAFQRFSFTNDAPSRLQERGAAHQKRWVDITHPSSTQAAAPQSCF